MNSDSIEEIVRWRMGSAYHTPILDWRDNRLNFDSPAFLDSAIAGGVTMDETGIHTYCPPCRDGYDPAKHKRFTDAAEDMLQARAGKSELLSAFLVMNDARIFSSVEYLGPPTGAGCAQVSYARPVESHWRSQAEIILWPLSEYVRFWALPKLSPAPWQDRRSQLLWRGQTTGMCYSLEESARPVFTGIRQMRRWLNVWLRDEVGENAENYERWSGAYQRLIAVSQCLKIPDTDVRFVPLWDGDTRSIAAAERFLGSSISSPRIDMAGYMAKRQEYKYVLSLPGNDIPSSLRHDMLSGCLVLMPRPFWESVWFFGLKPNHHYVELRADLADLEERIQWCQDNDGLCREIAQAGRIYALEHFEPSLELRIQTRVADRITTQTLPV